MFNINMPAPLMVGDCVLVRGTDKGYKECLYLSKIIKEFEEFEKLSYEKKRPKHEPTESYFRLARDIVKCMMRSDNLNWYDHCGYTKLTA